MGVKRLTDEEYNDRFEYLSFAAGEDLNYEALKMFFTDDHNPAKLVEALRRIQKAAQECALKLEELDLERRSTEAVVI